MSKRYSTIKNVVPFIVVAIIFSLFTACSSPASSNSSDLLDVANVSGYKAYDQITFTALEGIVNKSGTKIYLEGFPSNSGTPVAESDEFWLNHIVNLPFRRVAPLNLISQFRSDIKGLIIWDPSMIVDTENIATTLSGIKSALPVSPSMAKVLEQSPYNLPVLMDLRNNHFTSRLEAYTWAANYVKPFMSEIKFPVWIGDNTGDGKGGQSTLRDWITANDGFAFEANPSTDVAVINLVLGMFPKDTPVYGYIFFADAQYLKTGIAVLESVGVSEISRAGDYLIPSDTFDNLSLLHQLKTNVDFSPKWNSSPQTPDKSTVYVTFVLTDGDSLAQDGAFLLVHQWLSPDRGKYPMGVSISANLASLAPTMYAYYLKTATPNDVFVGGPSGAGYAYPSQMPNLDEYLSLSKQRLDQAGLKSVWILDNGYLSSPSPATISAYKQIVNPEAIFTDYDNFTGGYLTTPNPPAISFAGSTPVVHDVFGIATGQDINAIRATAQQAGGKPAFVFIGLDTWNSSYAQEAEIIKQLGPGYQVVAPDKFMGLILGARSLNEITAPQLAGP